MRPQTRNLKQNIDQLFSSLAVHPNAKRTIPARRACILEAQMHTLVALWIAAWLSHLTRETFPRSRPRSDWPSFRPASLALPAVPDRSDVQGPEHRCRRSAFRLI